MSDALTMDSGSISTLCDEGKLDSLRMHSLQQSGKHLDDRKMKEIANDFEAMLFRQMLKEMRKSIPKDGIIESSFSTEMYTDIADDHLAKQLAESNEMGIDKLIYDELKERESSSERKETSDFIPLKKKTDPILLKPGTVDFIKLNRGSGMMNLPQANNPMMPLGDRSRISTSRIDNSRG